MKKYIFILVIFIWSPVCAAETVAYPLPVCYSASRTFSVTVNGLTVPVIEYKNAQTTEYHYAHFSFSETATICIKASSDIISYKIRPESYGLTGTVSGKTLTFDLTKPRYLLININDMQNLIILADPPEEDIPPISGSGIYNIAQAPYNADGTGATDVTVKLQNAIDAASLAGGTVYVPAGLYMISSITMRSNVKLYLEWGAVLRGTGRQSDYVPDNPGTTTQAITTFIMFEEGACDMKIYGRGTIDCNGETLYEDGGGADPTAYRICGLRPNNNSNISIEGIIVSHGRTWTVVPQQSDNVTIENVKVLNSENRNENDGIDISNCQNVLVRHCFTYTNDDSICVKACKEGSFNGVFQGPSEDTVNVVFDDIVTYGKCAGTKVGVQGYTRVKNIWFKNIEVLQASRGIAIQHRQGGDTMEYIHFVNINVEELVYRIYIPFPIEMEITSTGNVSNVEVKNVTFKKFGNGETGDGYVGNNSRILGNNSNSRITGITFNNLKIAGNVILGLVTGRMTTNSYAMDITFIGSCVAEAESMSADVSPGGSYDILSSVNASGGKYSVGKLNTVGDYIQYTLQNIEQGTYRVSVVHGKETDSGVWQLKIDGSDQGLPVDRTSTTADFAEADLGTVTFDTTGSKTFRFVISGQSSGSTAYRIAIDAIKLTKQVPYPTLVTEHFVIDGTETTRYDFTTETGFWVDYTGSATLANAPLTISQTEGIIDFYNYRAAKLSAPANRYIQLWTPKNNIRMESFIASNKINYMTMRIKLSEPPSSNPYEYAIVAGNLGINRTMFLGELIRFCRPIGSAQPKIVLGGTPTTTDDPAGLDIYLVTGTGAELMSYSYNKWYTITFEINTEDPKVAVVKATVLDEETSAQTVSNPYSISTVNPVNSNAMCINALRMNTYVGYGGLAGDNFHIYLDYIKLFHSPSYTINFYRNSVAQENKIDVLEAGKIVGEAVLQEEYFQAVQQDSLCFVMAAYRDGKLIDMDVKNVSDTDSIAVLTISRVQSDDIIKWFTWDSSGQMNPLENVKRFDASGLKN